MERFSVLAARVLLGGNQSPALSLGSTSPILSLAYLAPLWGA
jgi:hypothetical protein